MRNILFLTLFSLFIVPLASYAEGVNVGFVQGLWYSENPVFADEPTRIYVAFRNNTEHDLVGTVRFSDNGARIGSSLIHALSGRLVEAWTDWIPTVGEHELTVVVSNAELRKIGGAVEPIDVAGILAEDTLTIDYDTDKDGVGNATDTDDDGDGVSDEAERTRGSDPLAPDPRIEEVQTMPDTSAEVSESTTPKSSSSQNEVTRQGLEKYISEGITNSLLRNVTEKVENAKQSLDSYRSKRNEERSPETEENPATTSSIISLDTYTDNATITRTKIETGDSLLSSFISGVASLFQNIWTFVLWALSKMLTHPAIVQVFLLLSILYILYRLVRRVGRRPNN